MGEVEFPVGSRVILRPNPECSFPISPDDLTRRVANHLSEEDGLIATVILEIGSQHRAVFVEPPHPLDVNRLLYATLELEPLAGAGTSALDGRE